MLSLNLTRLCAIEYLCAVITGLGPFNQNNSSIIMSIKPRFYGSTSIESISF